MPGMIGNQRARTTFRIASIVAKTAKTKIPHRVILTCFLIMADVCDEYTARNRTTRDVTK
ncbi:hypothetical protein D3C76_1855550 [compost metagenome]